MMSAESEKLVLLLRGAVIATMIVLAAVLRILPHPWNLTPVGAMALFSGAMFRNRWIAYVVPLAGPVAGGVVVRFHQLMAIVSRSSAISIAVGRRLGENQTDAPI